MAGSKAVDPSVPHVGLLDILVPFLWLLGIFGVGYSFGWPLVVVLFISAPLLFLLGFTGVGYSLDWPLEIFLLISATIYVYWNSRKFKISGNRALLTLLIAIWGLPIYASDLYALKRAQDKKPEIIGR